MNTSISSFLKTFVIVIVFVLVVLQLVGIFLFDIVRVNERQVALITRFGNVVETYGAGWHFKIPYIDTHAVSYDLTVRSVEASAASATKDQQNVAIKVNVQYRLDGSKARELFRLVKDQEYLEEAIVPSFIQEAVKSSSAKFTAAELLEKRDDFKTAVEDGLQNRLKEYYSDVVAVNIENIDWSEQFDRAIEAKVIAEQDALRKKQELAQAKIQAEIDITKAKAEAESTRIRGESLRQNPQVLEKAKIDKWDGKLPQVQGDNSVIIDLKEKNR